MSSFSYEYGTLNIQLQASNTSSHSRPSHLFNSTSKLQDFFGVDDIQELQISIPEKRNSAPVTAKIRSIFTTKHKKTRRLRECKKIRRGLNKLRKEKKERKLIKVNEKIIWRPPLQTIFSDHLLLNTLSKFMQNSYNSENLLFLQAVKALNGANHKNIDNKIINIYNKYIIPYCEYQINLSYHCLMNIMSKKDEFMSYNDIKAKCKIFSLCVEEIENLIITSILGSFYRSSLFQSNARKSKLFIDNHSPSNSSQYSPYSSLSPPPIPIESSMSTESFFDFDA